MICSIHQDFLALWSEFVTFYIKAGEWIQILENEFPDDAGRESRAMTRSKGLSMLKIAIWCDASVHGIRLSSKNKIKNFPFSPAASIFLSCVSHYLQWALDLFYMVKILYIFIFLACYNATASNPERDTHTHRIQNFQAIKWNSWIQLCKIYNPEYSVFQVRWMWGNSVSFL